MVEALILLTVDDHNNDNNDCDNDDGGDDGDDDDGDDVMLSPHWLRSDTSDYCITQLLALQLRCYNRNHTNVL